MARKRKPINESMVDALKKAIDEQNPIRSAAMIEALTDALNRTNFTRWELNIMIPLLEKIAFRGPMGEPLTRAIRRLKALRARLIA